MKRIFSAVTVIASTLIPMLASAHPGHGHDDGYTIKHYFSEPLHIFASVGVLVVTFTLIRFAQKRKEQTKK
ncbi:MAG: hypothetical protein IPP51_03150 [Bacteroidetes bacterium]|nr:hypothetical protein [Bacteroidota bacterium]